MPERLQKILDRIVEWWKKFNNKQRALLISITAAVVVALVILGVVVSRPTMVEVYSAVDMKEASSINSILKDSGIKYKTTDAGKTFWVESDSESAANYLLAENNYPSVAYDINSVTNGSFSTTESDKQKLYIDYLQKKFASDLSAQTGIESATVTITLPDDDGTILAKDEQGTAAVSLELSKSLTEEQAYGIALFVATELGNDSTEGITIIDQDNNIIYSGADSSSSSALISSHFSNTQKQTEWVETQVKKALASSYTNIDVASHLEINYANKKVTEHDYSAPDGQTNGMIGSQSTYDAEAHNYDGDIPGTDSNNDTTTYMITDNGNSSYTVSDVDTQYQNNEKITETIDDGGTIDSKNSSVSVVATRYVTYTEEQLRASGALSDDVTYEEYQNLNSEPTEETTDTSFIEVVSNATGIPTANISFKSYVQPIYKEKAETGRSVSDILQIVLAILIFVLLGYVVFKSTRKQTETEAEPELSVESLLEATQDNGAEEALEDIGYSEKSETRILIEKFVDENPDAAALLLRNWLNDEWE